MLQEAVNQIKLMKRGIKSSVFLTILVIQFAGLSSFSQNKILNLRYQNEMWKLWSLDLNAGLLSFYGDVSSHDDNYFDKLKYESGPALSLNVTKHFSRLFALSGQLLVGNLNGLNGNVSFEADLIEYNLNAKINLFNLFYPINEGKFRLTAQAGLGQFLFTSEQVIKDEGLNTSSKHEVRVPEFVYFLGVGTFFKTSDKLAISLDLSIRQCQNDRLDVLVKNNDYDYYSYLSLGIIYYLDVMKKGPVKNKARIAHNNSRHKHLTY